MGAARTAIRMVGMAGLLGIVFLVLVGDQHPLDVGTPAPPTRLRMLDGNVVDVPFGAASETTPLFVNIWATWCPPCIQELPELEAASRRYQGRVRFVGFAFQSPLEDTKAMVARFGLSYPVGMLGGDGRAWGAETLPSSYLVGVDGKILWSTRGAIDGKTIDRVLESALGADLSRPDATPGKTER